MAYSSLSAFLQTQFNYNVSGPTVSSSIAFPAPSVNNTLSLKTSYGLGTGAGLINSVAVNILAISASSSATLNLQSLMDVLGATAILVSLKEYVFELLSAAQDSVNGTTCTSVVIGNAGSNANPLNMGGTAPTLTLLNGDQQSYGTASAAGLTVSSSVKNVLVTNSDSVHAAAVLYGFGGHT